MASSQAPRPTIVQRLSRRAAIAFAVFTAAAGAVLGVVPDLVAGNTSQEEFQLKAWAGGWLAVGGLVALLLGWLFWRKRDVLLAQRGTVYVVDSPAEDWTPESKEVFLKGAVNEFASVLHVPGPTGLTTWRWPTDERAVHWSDAVDELVLSYRSVFVNDDSATPNSVVCWSWFAVAIAWTSRLKAAERNLRLSVRQRPSPGGRQAEIDTPPWSQGVHSFARLEAYQATGEILGPRPLHLTVAGGTPATSSTEVGRVLLVRMTGGPWDVVECDHSPEAVSLSVVDHSGASLQAGDNCDLLEWRNVVPKGQAHQWRDFPALVSEICDWIADNASKTGATLIGMQVPQEVSMGIGINVASRDLAEWPATLWPLIKPRRADRLIVPGLDLGYQSLHRWRGEGPR